MCLPIFGKEVQAADLFFIFILIAMVRSIRKVLPRALFIRPISIGYIFGLWLIVLFVSCLFSSNRLTSLVELFTIIYLGTLYLWIGGIHFDEKRFGLVLNAWIWVSGVLCVLGLAGLITYSVCGSNMRLVQDYPAMRSVFPFARIVATFPTMNMFASFLHVGVVFLLFFAISGRWRPYYFIPSALILFCLPFTASRNMLGIAVTVSLAILPVKGKSYLPLLKLSAVLISFLLFVMVVVTTVWCIFPAKINFDKETHAISFSVNKLPSLYAFLDKMAFRMIAQRPLTGVGPGMFNRSLVEKLDWEEAKDIYGTYGDLPKDSPMDPHSTYLGWAAEAGIPFLIVMIGLFYAVGCFLWKGYKRADGSFTGIFCYACLCGMIGFMINGFYIDILTMRHFWIMLGLGTIAAFQIRARKEG